MNGVISRIPTGKLFGFIRAGEVDYFFHKQDFNGFWDDLVSDLVQGDIQVSFNIVESPKGPRAGYVRRLDYPNQAV